MTDRTQSAAQVLVTLRVSPSLRDELASAAAAETIKQGGKKVSVNTLVTEMIEKCLTETRNKKS